MRSGRTICTSLQLPDCTPRCQRWLSRQRRLDELEILDELLEGHLALLVFLQAQERRRMQRGEDIRRERALDELAALDRHLEVLADYGLRRGRAERDDDVRLDCRDLGFEPLLTGVD